MLAEGIRLSEAQRVRIVDLIGNLLNDVWRRANNGWSPNELAKERDVDKAAKSVPPARPAPPEIKVTPRRPKRKRPHKKRRR